MKWLLIFVMATLDTPVYLEFKTQDACLAVGKEMQADVSMNGRNYMPVSSTFTCVEQE